MPRKSARTTVIAATEEKEDVFHSPAKRKVSNEEDDSPNDVVLANPKPQKKQTRASSSSSSSSSSSNMKSRRKKSSLEDVDGDEDRDDEEEDEQEERGDDQIQDIFKFGPENTTATDIRFREGTEKQLAKWDKLNGDMQGQLIKTVARLFLLKGSKNETITRTHINDALEKIDKAYKVHIDVVLAQAQFKLKKNFGYIIVSGDSILGCAKANKEKSTKEYYLSSNLTSRKLWTEVTRGNKEPGFDAFKYVVFNNIFMSASKQIVCKDLLKNLRQLDRQFPETILKEGTKTIIRELGDDFPGLMSRLVKEKYIQVVQMEDIGAPTRDAMEVVYTFGTRFYLELGNTQLAKAMFAINGEPIDETFVERIRQDNEEDMKQAMDQEN